MCLKIWRGLTNGPAMHSMHFCFALGTFLAPLLASPFLNVRKGPSNSTSIDAGDQVKSESLVGIYYPIVGSLGLLIAAGFFYFGWKKHHYYSKIEDSQQEQELLMADDKGRLPFNILGFLHCLFLFFFLVVGLEVAVGGYTTTFAVKSKLHMTRAEGSYSTAIFSGVFTLTRFIAIFAANR